MTPARRFQPGQAFGGGLAVVDTQRQGRAVCIVLPDPLKPDAAGKLAEVFASALNAIHEKSAKPAPTK